MDNCAARKQYFLCTVHTSRRYYGRNAILMFIQDAQWLCMPATSEEFTRNETTIIKITTAIIEDRERVQIRALHPRLNNNIGFTFALTVGTA